MANPRSGCQLFRGATYHCAFFQFPLGWEHRMICGINDEVFVGALRLMGGTRCGGCEKRWPIIFLGSHVFL